MQDPRLIYSQLLDKRRLDLAARDQQHRVFGYLQLAAVVSALAAVGLALFHKLSIFWVFAPAAAFATLFIIHERLLRVAEQRRRSIRYFERALDRLEGKWAGQGEAGDRFLDPAHPYARDLDLFGKGSLFELLCTARTQVGVETLAEWLLYPADPDTVRSRQLAVDDLRSQVDWREELAVVADEARSGVHATALAAWGEAAPLLASRRLRILTTALALLGVPGLVAFLAYSLYMLGIVHLSERMAVLSRDFFVLVLFINGTFLFKQRRRVDLVVAAAEAAEFSGPSVDRPARIVGCRGRAHLETPEAVEPADRPPGRPRTPADSADRTLPALDAALGGSGRRVATPLGAGGAPVARLHRRNRGAVLAGQPRLRASCRSFPRISIRIAMARSRSHRPPLAGRESSRPQRRTHRPRATLAGGERFQHVGQEYAAADLGRECGARSGGGTGARQTADALAARRGRVHPYH